MTDTRDGSINLTDRYLVALLRQQCSILALSLSRRGSPAFYTRWATIVRRCRCKPRHASFGYGRRSRLTFKYGKNRRRRCRHRKRGKEESKQAVCIIYNCRVSIRYRSMSKSIQRVKRIINFRAHQIGSTLVVPGALVNYNVREEAALERERVLRNGPARWQQR